MTPFVGLNILTPKRGDNVMENAEAKNQLLIKFVALYLRKSRGDLEKDLEKHRKVLVKNA